MNFFAELIIRLFGKTPKFFKIVRTLGLVLTVITGLPAFLAAQGIELPAPIDAIASQVVAIASALGALVSQLTMTSEEKQKEGVSD